MPATKVNDYTVKLVKPDFDSFLTDLIIDLDHLRKKLLIGSTPPSIFFQLKHIFHTLESIGSARIEGNNTTIAEYIETKLEDKSVVSAGIKEIQNIEKAMTFVEDNIKDYPINRILVSEIHKMVVEGLEAPPKGEGDYTPGEYRKKNVKIAQAHHVPPEFLRVNEHMNGLFNFIQRIFTY